jgi:hypothetical protein
MIGFLAIGVSFAERQQRICPYFHDFSTSSSWLFFFYVRHLLEAKLCNAINQA